MSPVTAEVSFPVTPEDLVDKGVTQQLIRKELLKETTRLPLLLNHLKVNPVINNQMVVEQ